LLLFFISYADGNAQENDIPFGQLDFNNMPVNQNVSREFSLLLLFST